MKITELFDVVKGQGQYYSKVEEGSTPLVSATTVNNGIIGRVDLEPTFRAPCITVERVSGQAFVQFEDFATVPDDISVLIPQLEMTREQLFYVAAVINSSRWRFSYGRKLTATRLKKLFEVDLERLPHFVTNIEKYRLADAPVVAQRHPHHFEEKPITDYFELVHGDFHSLDALDAGSTPTVSRITYNNGVVGHYESPADAVIHPPLTLTVSTTSGDAFLQVEHFMATDNVVVLRPLIDHDLYLLLYIQAAINRTKWRYYYGRQCYKNRFAKTRIFIPMDKDGHLDKDYIVNKAISTPGWQELEAYLSKA